MVLVPAATAVASPVIELIVAVAAVPELQVTELETSAVVLSVKMPVAVNCRVKPFNTDGLAGVTAIDRTSGALTVSVVALLIAPDEALIVVVPSASVVTSPPAAIVALLVSLEAQVAVVVRFCVVPSL
jgi:hypothetical protein